MLRKINVSFQELLKKLKKLIRIPHFSEVVSVCKQLNEVVKNFDDKTVDLLSSVFLFVSSLVIGFVLIIIYAFVGGYIL